MTLKQVFLSFGLIFLIGNVAFAQKFLQLEIYNSVNTRKFSPGDKIVVKTKEFPEEWQKKRIESIMYEDGIIVFPQGMINVEDITEVRIFKPIPFSLAKGLYLFSIRSLVFGGIDQIYRGEFDKQILLYTVLPTAFGLFLDKFVSYKVYKMNKNSRLRLLDLTL